MSAVLRLPSYNGKPNNIFLIYNFQQVSNTMMMIIYVHKVNRWKKIMINYEDEQWNTKMLNRFMDADTYQQVCNKLSLIYPSNTSSEEVINLEQTIQQEAAFVLGMYC